MAESKGFFRRTPVRLRVASLLDHVGKNSPPDCFLPQTSLLPPCSNPSFCFANAKSRPCDLLFVLAESKGFFRCTPVRLRVASLLDHVGKNSPPDCFLPQTASAPSLFESLFLFCQSKKQALRPAFRFGGEQGIRTLEQALTCYTISNRAPSASSDNSPNSFSLFN